MEDIYVSCCGYFRSNPENCGFWNYKKDIKAIRKLKMALVLE